MKLLKLVVVALALSFVVPQAIDAKPKKKARTTKVAKSKKSKSSGSGLKWANRGRKDCNHTWDTHFNSTNDIVVYTCIFCYAQKYATAKHY